MNVSDLLKAGFPILVAAIGWLLTQVNSYNDRLMKIEGHMLTLVTPEGLPSDSPVSAERRQQIKEEIYAHIHDLQVRVTLLERANAKSN